MLHQTPVALDVGRSALKVAYRDTATGQIIHRLTPTAVIPAFTITDPSERERVQQDTVTIGNETFFVGQTALAQQKESENALTDEWVFSAEYLALLTHGLEHAGVSNPFLILGLPSKAQRHHGERLKMHAMDHFNLDAMVLPQPMGLYYGHMLGDTGVPSPGRVMARESWACVDIGRYSTDLILMMNGVWVEQASESSAGVVTAVDHLRRALRDEGVELEFSEAESALMSKTLRWYGEQRDISALTGKAIEHLVHDVTSTITRLLNDHVRKLDGVIIAGGGAQFVAQAFRDRWPHVVVPNDIRLAVSEGMRRAGEANIRAQLRKRLA